ncbi:DUF3175 domain-containing protein [Krasilnikoviella flava]|nr:DUF3175 domain-containing protein [Krasilnikoviella flava]
MAKQDDAKQDDAKQDDDASGERWSHDVTEHSDALDLEDDVFTWDDPARIAASLKRSAEASDRRKGTPYQSAMSMLTFYVNRAGANLPAAQRDVLDRAKDELRTAFGRD